MDYPFPVRRRFVMMSAWLHTSSETQSIMKRSIFHPTHPVTAIATQAQAELLATTMTIRFPARIQTVGEAVRYLLQRSGYRLVHVELISLDTAVLFALPLPVVHQSLGPMTLRDALETLAGPAFHLVQDSVHRLVTFERCVANRFAVQVTGATIKNEVVQDED